MRTRPLSFAVALCLAPLTGCGEDQEQTRSAESVRPGQEQPSRELSGTIRIDGPRVLRSLIGAADQNFEDETSVEVQVEQSGTEAALEKLCAGRIAIAGARRAIRPAERQVCGERGIGLTRVKIANHVVGVATSSELAMRCITMRQLRELWKPGSPVTRYEQLDSDFPSEQVKLYGPKIGHDSFALFTRLVNGRRGAVRAGWQTVVNRTALSARLRRSADALAFYNLAQLRPVEEDARLLAIDSGDGCVKPTSRNIWRGRYPLQEPLYLYVSKRALEQLRVRSFMQYFVENYDQVSLVAPSIVPASEREIVEAERRLPEAEFPPG
jgi:phosphate transport system substrate-binding protein